MTAKEYINLLQLARIRENWTEELFKQYQQACIEMNPCIFNELRKILPEEEYKEFDLAYCEYIQPGQKGVVEYLEELHGREAAKQWGQKMKKKKKQTFRNSPKSNFLLISKELGFQLEKTE